MQPAHNRKIDGFESLGSHHFQYMRINHMENCPHCNKRLDDSADRKYLKVMVGLLTPGQQDVFKRMYSHQNLDKSIDAIIDDMPQERLAWATKQVENTRSNVKYD